MAPTRGAQGADIFVSYKKDDEPRVRLLVEALALQGWTVWWDPEIRTGEEWSEEIERALAQARCVVVVWSELSVRSSWVKREARDADGRGVLAPVMLDKVAPPVEFNHIQGADLVGWIGSPKDPRFMDLVRHVEGVLGQRAEPRAETTGRFVRRVVRYRAHLVAAGIALLTWTAGGAYLSVPVQVVDDLELRDVRLSGVRFGVAPPSESQSTGGTPTSVGVTSRFAVTEVVAAAAPGQVLSVDLPRAFRGGGIVEGAGYAPDIAVLGPPDTDGSLELEVVEVPVGARVAVSRTPGADGYTLEVDGVPAGHDPPRLELRARGPVSVWLPDGPDATLDFGAPGREILLEPMTGGITLELSLQPGPPTTILENVPVSGIEISAVEETVELERSRAVRRSTVESGTLVVAGTEHALGPSRTVRFGSFEGLVGRLATVDGSLRLDAAGHDVSAIEVGAENDYESLMPSRWRALSDPWPAVTVVAAVLWGVLLLLFVPRFWRAPR